MKVTIDRKDKEADKPFPKLMISDMTDTIILFLKLKCGTVVEIGTSKSGIVVGDYDSDWNMDCFKEFHGTITLEND